MIRRITFWSVIVPLAICYVYISAMPTYTHYRGIALTKLCAVKAAEDEARMAAMMGELAKVKIPALALPEVGM